MDQTAFLGIIMLDTEFPRLPGDVGNPATFDFPVRYQIVEGASVDQIVTSGRPNERLCEKFVQAAQSLEKQGAVGLVTSCGFLSIIQTQLAQAVRIPVISSALNLVPLLQSSLAEKPIGIITADASRLSSAALTCAGIDINSVYIKGMENSVEFNKLIYQTDDEIFCKDRLAEEFEQLTDDFISESPDIAALVLECTNLQLYTTRIFERHRLPVYSIVHAANLLWQGTINVNQS